MFVSARRSRHGLLQTALHVFRMFKGNTLQSTASGNEPEKKTKIFLSFRHHSPHICLTWYPSNPPLNFSRSEANTFRSKVKQSVCPELVERVQVTRASIGVLYLFLPSHERAYSTPRFLTPFAFLSLDSTLFHLFILYLYCYK